MVNATSIDVIIRFKEVEPFLPLCISSIRHQQDVFLRLILVDSSTNSPQIRFEGKIIKYNGSFNYSKAINLGLQQCTSSYVLVLSSHCIILNSSALAYGISLLEESPLIAAVSFSDSNFGTLQSECINKANFNGFNGAHNYASIYRRSLLSERLFDEYVFSSEDQIWSRWAIHEKMLGIIHVQGCGTINLNPGLLSIAKRLKEWEFISFFADRSYLSLAFISSQLFLSVVFIILLRPKKAHYLFLVFGRLLRTKLYGPLSTDSSYR